MQHMTRLSPIIDPRANIRNWRGECSYFDEKSFKSMRPQHIRKGPAAYAAGLLGCSDEHINSQ